MKNILVFTGTRADYGLLTPLVNELIADDEIHCELFITGTHLSDDYGNTVEEIQKNNHPTRIQVPFLDEIPKIDLVPQTSLLMSKALEKFARVLSIEDQRKKIHTTIILGDRYEALSFGLACVNQKIPIIHIHGGELTHGSLDEIYRHCLTKCATLHFCSHEDYKKRVIQLGENPKSVFSIGPLVVDTIKNHALLSDQEIEDKFFLKNQDDFYLLTLHPETSYSNDQLEKKLDEFFSALSEFFPKKMIFTMPNSDAKSEIIRQKISQFFEMYKNLDCIYLYESLGHKNYLSLAKKAKAVIGNSSSGVIEVPYLKTPTLNIGKRQDGRIMQESVYCCEFRKDQIIEGIKFVSSQEFQEKSARMNLLEGSVNVSKTMVEIIKKEKSYFRDDGDHDYKVFYDL